jgi:hemerythrin superfamily protein
MIKNDHRLLEDLFSSLGSGDGDRRALIAEVTARLTAHAYAEEEHVYPAITRAEPDERPAVGHAYREHQEAVHLLRKVRNLVDSPHFEQALDEFVAAVRHHVEEEETTVLPALARAVDADTLERLGEAFEGARRDRLEAAGIDEGGTRTGGDARPAGPPHRGRSGGGDGGRAGNGKASPPDLKNASRDELYELARRADIPGRSSMNKTELARALRAVSD